MASQKIKANLSKNSLPAIPDKLYFTIGEVGRLCQLRPHVLRYWEQEFSQLSPSKRRGNRRYYQHRDVVLIRKIKDLLYEQGYTIEGARQQLAAGEEPVDSKQQSTVAVQSAVTNLEKLVEQLEEQS